MKLETMEYDVHSINRFLKDHCEHKNQGPIINMGGEWVKYYMLSHVQKGKSFVKQTIGGCVNVLLVRKLYYV